MKPIELSEILAIADIDSVVEWVATNIDCDVMIEAYGKVRIVRFTNIKEWLKAIRENLGASDFLEEVLDIIGMPAINEYLKDIEIGRLED